ncbi:sensor histidine kinase [Pseudonocardia spinosispora]|uniref:sensor histidine kinase n=1 Tax=Pseudonocardia spinosispora TaxID=103441 RepID=UPI0003F6DDD6|nr:HAMP domain-containing sensor histidine kinase [Pseudonocardia spinosispora]
MSAPQWPEPLIENLREPREQRVVVLVRLAVVVSWALLLILEPQVTETHRVAAWAVLATAAVYSTILAVWQRRDVRPPPSWSITLMDSLLTLLACGFTGGTDTLVVAVLPLIVIAAGLGGRRGYVVATGLGLGYALAVYLSGEPVGGWRIVLHGLWWTGYLLATAVLVEVFSRLLERQYAAAAKSRAEAIAEHEALLEERDLRARLSESQHARQDGLRVILHEFRTPVSSMTALSKDLASGTLTEPASATALSLINAHAEHLRDMLDNLADLALADGSPVGRPRERMVSLAELADVVMDAAAIPAHRRFAAIDPEGGSVWSDPQLLRRVLTNLAENAARHSTDGPVELHLTGTSNRLVAEVRDRGPGLPPDQLGEVSRKYVSLGDRRGTAGLGLWIVAQLVGSLKGQLTLSARESGGLVARLEIPLPPPRE